MKFNLKLSIKIFIFVIVFLILFEVLGISSVIISWTQSLMVDEAQDKYPLENWQLVGLMLTIFFMFLSSILGNIVARKKNRNVWFWSLTCFIFNIYAFIILIFLPKAKE